jgi:hypothetical protein
MKPMLAFWLCVLFSELSQWCVWKKGNPTKRWKDWLASGIPHFGANLGIVVLICILWDAQILSQFLPWSFPYTVPMGAILGYAIDKLGDQVGRLIDLTLSSRLQKVTGVIGKFDGPAEEETKS